MKTAEKSKPPLGCVGRVQNAVIAHTPFRSVQIIVSNKMPCKYIAQLEAELEKVKRERDAAVWDMTFKSRCGSCKHYDIDMAAHPCNKCKTIHMGVHDMWEWRGLFAENGGAQE